MDDKKEVKIELNNVSKRFRRSYKKRQSLLLKLLSFLSLNESKKEFSVLENISFKVKSGENLGIIGENGSGKSTLLRIIAGIYKSNRGKIITKGKLIYLTGFGQGLKPKLTMRENIYLIGSMRGLSQKDIKLKFNEIVDFAGLKDYVDTKVYQFSSGMITRLSFSITIHCITHKNPDILLIDEAIGAGADIDFQNKALKKMEELIKGGATVILVSHSLEQIRKYCNKVILLKNGKIIKQGNPKKVCDYYEKKDLKKNIIYTIKCSDVGDWYKKTLPTIKKYSEKINADLKIIDDDYLKELLSKNSDFRKCIKNILNYRLHTLKKYVKIHWLKFYIIKDFANSSYDKMLFLDLDIKVKNDSPNIFDRCNKKGFYIKKAINNLNENDFWNFMKLNFKIEKSQKFDYCNSGVFLINKKTAINLIKNFPNSWYNYLINLKFDTCPRTKDLLEQGTLNYLLYKSNIRIFDLDEKWNSFYDYFSKKGYFIHYLGKKGKEHIR